MIGRNEGERLTRSLESVRRCGMPVVYVDSGSEDGSAARARALGIECLELDADRPYSAARGRNEGFLRLLGRHPDIAYVQFLDGDCELDPSWPACGAAYLDAQPEVAIAFGRLRERSPEASVYNRLCDMEWEHDQGEVDEALGVMLVRAAAFGSVGGFADGLVAGEEGDLCVRLIRAGHQIHCVDAPMGTHDAGMLHFGQWWTRSLRNGYGCCRTLFASLSGRDVEFQPYDLRCLASALAWMLLVPAVALGLALEVHAAGLLLAPLAWSLFFLRVSRARRRSGATASHAALYARFILLGKLADLAGLSLFLWDLLGGRGDTQAIRHRDRATA